jgi:hypothetical protein
MRWPAWKLGSQRSRCHDWSVTSAGGGGEEVGTQAIKRGYFVAEWQVAAVWIPILGSWSGALCFDSEIRCITSPTGISPIISIASTVLQLLLLGSSNELQEAGVGETFFFAPLFAFYVFTFGKEGFSKDSQDFLSQ